MKDAARSQLQQLARDFPRKRFTRALVGNTGWHKKKGTFEKSNKN